MKNTLKIFRHILNIQEEFIVDSTTSTITEAYRDSTTNTLTEAYTMDSAANTSTEAYSIDSIADTLAKAYSIIEEGGQPLASETICIQYIFIVKTFNLAC